MKTTVHIPDALLDEVRKIAVEENTTLKALVEQGLRRVLAEKKRRAPVRHRRVGFKGNGLRPELEGASWERILELAYEGRGG
jgi:Arc/MetJ family transcription regulator